MFSATTIGAIVTYKHPLFVLQGLEAVPELRTLLAASNRFETLDDLRPLWGCRCLTTVDLRNNKLESEEGLLQLLQARL